MSTIIPNKISIAFQLFIYMNLTLAMPALHLQIDIMVSCTVLTSLNVEV